MVSWLVSNWQLVAVVAGLGLLIVPRLGGVWTWIRSKVPAVTPAVPSEPSLAAKRAEQMAAYDLLYDSLPQCRSVLASCIGPAILAFGREEVTPQSYTGISAFTLPENVVTVAPPEAKP